MEREILFPKTAMQKKLAAQQKAYYEANREKLAAQKKAYREANREKLAAQQKGAILRRLRKERGYTQKALGALCGFTQGAISMFELGMLPLNGEAFEDILPGICRELEAAA